MSKPETELRQQIVDVCKRLYERNLLAACDGNVSCRLSPNEILITPSGRCKGIIEPEDLVVMSLDGKTKSGAPSTERLLHLAIYREAPLAHAVVHAHPPSAVAFTIVHPDFLELPFDSLPEVLLACGRVPILKYAVPGTEALAVAVGARVNEAKVMLLARHGSVSWGESLEEAFYGADHVEHSCRMLIEAIKIGGPKPVSAAELDQLIALRAKIGFRTL